MENIEIDIPEKYCKLLGAKKKTGRKTNRPPVAELAELYQNRTTRELAEYYGVPEGTVKGWIFYYRHKAPQEGASE